MTRRTATPQDLKRTAAILTPASDFTLKDRDAPDFFQDLYREFGGFLGHALVSEYSFDTDWESWEVHPKGDELIYLLSGAATFLYRLEGEEVSVSLDTPGQYLVIPMGAWHTARTTTPASALFITPGADTEHAETPPA